MSQVGDNLTPWLRVAGRLHFYETSIPTTSIYTTCRARGKLDAAPRTPPSLSPGLVRAFRALSLDVSRPIWRENGHLGCS